MPYILDPKTAQKIVESTKSRTLFAPEVFFECRTTLSTQLGDTLYTSSGLLLEILKIREDFRKNPEKYPKADDAFWE